ncbi:hypothetical protein [Roseovarius aestuariivivens]|uniref:hypothetical protein n=1 Tax=Roseovarius aestuariivivens TaxID=1888910 RepID=UPI0010809DA8|nr:hypothetical protein [Roseovarius aestuariivivens]
MDLDNLDGVGIGAASDAVNRLAVASDASLFSHAGSGHQIKINKAASGDTAALLYQSGWSGRAEMGLNGSDQWSIKVSPDGAAWTTALALDPDTGLASGAAVQSDPEDATPGRVMTVGAFGLGDAPLDAGAKPAFSEYGTVTGFVQAGSATGGAADRPVPAQDHWGWTANADAQNGAQFLIEGSNRAFLRTKTDGSGGAYSDWVEFCTRADILGVVGQAGGVPTGAIMESGSNTNGEYVRFADGTQLVKIVEPSSNGLNATSGLGSLFVSSAPYDWVFPAAFQAAPTVFGCVRSSDPCWISARPVSPLAAEARLISPTTLGTRGFDLVAFGRWF